MKFYIYMSIFIFFSCNNKKLEKSETDKNERVLVTEDSVLYESREQLKAGSHAKFKILDRQNNKVLSFSKNDTFYITPVYRTRINELKGRYKVELEHANGNFALTPINNNQFKLITNDNTDTLEYLVYLSSIDGEYLFKSEYDGTIEMFDRMLLYSSKRVIPSLGESE